MVERASGEEVKASADPTMRSAAARTRMEV
jgi:hypothetical protein